MKIRNIIIAFAVIAFVPALVSAQEVWTLGREGKMMQLSEALKSIKANKAAQDSLKAKKSAKKTVKKAAKKAGSSVNYAYLGREGKMLAMSDVVLERAKTRAEAQKKHEDFLKAELAAVPAEDKARYDALLKAKNYTALAEDIKKLCSCTSANKNKYYILTEVVKANGQGLASTGSLKVSAEILKNTSKDSYVYKEAQKVFDRINSSGKAL